jgi:hypothetical protein
MRIFKKTLLALTELISALVLIVLITVSAAWLKPEWVLTQHRVDQLYDLFAAPYFVQKPEVLKFELRPNGLFGKHVYLDVSSFCLKEPDGCFDRVHLEFTFKFIQLTKIQIEKIGPLIVLNRTLTFHESKEKEQAKKKESTSGFNLMKHLSFPVGLKVDDIEIKSSQITLPGKDPLIFTVDMKGAASDRLKAEVTVKTATGLSAKASVESGFTFDGSNPFKAKVEAHDGWNISGNLEGDVVWSKLEGEVKGSLVIRKLIPWVETLAVKNIRLKRSPLLALSADLETRIEPKLQFRARDSALPSVSFNTGIDGKLNVVEKDDVFQYKLQLGPLKQRGMELLAHAEGRFPFPKDLEHRYGLDKALVKIDIPRFQTVVASLKNTSSAIPAPFSALKGSVHLRIGSNDGAFTNDTAPLELVTNLSSSEQVVKTQSKGSALFDKATRKIKISGESRIELIRFTLPDLDVLIPQPALASDSRIVSIKKIEKQIKVQEDKEEGVDPNANSKVEFAWKLTTAPSGIQVNHPIFHPHATAEVTWNLTKAGSFGEIKLLPFEVEYLHRRASVDHLRYYLNEGEKIFHYDGKLVIPKTDYTLFITIYDQSGKPKVEMSSEPPLAQADIISVLLFNQTTGELDPDQSSSVASTQAAVTNRALGLFSMWALSSTPIEAVNFNPSTRVYSARVRLASGLTASIGTNWENTQEVALRKRLGKNFVLSTSVQNDKETNTESKKTLLEWFRRF